MSYNIDTFKLKAISNLRIPLWALFTSERNDWHPDRVNNDDGTVEFTSFDGIVMKGTVKDEVFLMDYIECSGEGSGSFVNYILEPALKQSKGLLRASCVWEGGDSINKLLVEDGEVDWIEIDI